MSAEDLVVLQEKLINHLHAYEVHILAEDERWERMFQICEKNVDDIAHLTVCIADLTNSTASVVDMWDSAQSVVRVGGLIGTLGKWLASIAFIGVAAKWGFDILSKN